MKKLLLFLFCAFIFSNNVSAQELVPLTVTIDNDLEPIGNGYPRTPMQAPMVYIDDYTLLFAVDHPEYVLRIKDEDGTVVYTTVVYSSDTQVFLPQTLFGDYQIELALGYWLFKGWINL